jgi:hypothetical protein
MVQGRICVMRYSAVQYSTVQCSAVQYSTVQCRTVQQSSVHNSTAQCSTLTSSGSMPCFLICILSAPPSLPLWPPCFLACPALPASTPHSSGSKRCAGHAADNCALSLTSPITLPCYPFHVVMEGRVHQPSPAPPPPGVSPPLGPVPAS